MSITTMCIPARSRIASLSRHLLVGSLGILMALLLAGSLLVLFTLPSWSVPAFAASLVPQSVTACAQAPSLQHCNHQDPERQGCAADAQTIAQADIVQNGMVIGRVERRYSHACQSWWGRVFDERVGSYASMWVTIGDTTISAQPSFVSPSYRILYSSMIFDATPTQMVPQVIGALSLGNIPQPASATLPAIQIPG